MNQFKFTPPHQYILIINTLFFLMVFLSGCKKEDIAIPESKIEQLRNQVSDWYYQSTKEVLADPDASTKRIASNSLNTQTSTDYSVL